MAFFENVCKHAERKGVTLSRLERELGLGNGAVKCWRVCSPRLATALKVADYFGTSLDDLCRDD